MRRRRRAREDRRPILKKLCASFLRSFRGHHGEKMEESAWGNWDPRKSQQPFQPNPNGVGDRATTLKRLLLGIACANMDCYGLTLNRRHSSCFFSCL